ncbi:S41 family peptidase, partial [Schnuerera sp.]|uniref:S41 family peptidase n=1 Tax=Schnuerera sp. TaxID=2794844 RepID=UPI002C7641A1
MTSKNRKYKYLVGDPSRVSLSCYAQDDREDIILNISKEPHLCHSKHSKTSHLCHSERSEESHFCHPEHSETPYLCHSERSEESRFCHPEHSEESHFCHSEHSETPYLCHSERSEESRFKKHNLKIIKKISTLLLIISLLLTPTLSIADSPYNVDYFLNIKNIIEHNSFYEPTEEELLQGAIKGLFQSLDPNSQYYTQEEFQTLWEDISGDFVGIGVYIKEEKDSIIITEPIKGSPAYKAGIKPGDKLISVDGKNVEGKSLEEVTSLIKGEPGTSVRIGVNRQEKNIQVNIKRAEIKINPVEYKILKDKIGYIKISQFNPNTYENLVSALKKLDKENISSIIIDLRDNPGGLLG